MTPPASDRLESWKEIAAFLNRGVRTVQRWERMEGLPVHRLMHDRQGTVYALKPEIEAWLASRSERIEAEPEPKPKPVPVRRPPRLVLAASLGAIAVVIPLAAWRIGFESHREISLAAPTPFTAAVGSEEQPSFSPDGRHVVYASGDLEKKNFDLYVQAIDRGEPKRFTSDPAYESNPAWSPDGQAIAYIRSEADKPADLIVQPVIRGAARKVGEVRFHGQSFPVVSWAGGSEWLIVSDKPAPDQPSGLFRIHSRTGERKRITTCDDACLSDSAIALTANRSTLLFLRTVRGGTRDAWLLDVNAHGEPAGPPRQLTKLNALMGPPSWLPGDREIAIPLLIDFVWTWQRIGRSGTGLRTFDEFAGVRPGGVFSPDGQYILAPDYDHDSNIRRVDLATGAELDVIASTRIDTNAQISPDGRQIVFPSSRRGNIDLWRTDADGSNPVQIHSAPGKSSGTPRWSPDGKLIAFDIADSSTSDIYVMNSDGTGVRRLTDHPARDYVPNWSRDGRWIYFGSERDGESQVYKVSVRGGTPVRITRNGGFAGQEAPEGDALYVTKTNGKGTGMKSMPSLWRVQMADGVETPVPDVPTDWSRYVVRDDGIYFIGYGQDYRHVLRVFDFKTKTTRDLRTLERPSGMGFSVAPDARWAVYTSETSTGSDLLLRRVLRR